MDEGAPVPQENNANVIALLVKMKIQQKEDAFIQNERISNIYNLVKIQNKIFWNYSNIQDQRYSTLEGMLQSQAENLASFHSTFLQHFPNLPPDAPENNDTDNLENWFMFIYVILFKFLCYPSFVNLMHLSLLTGL